MPLLRAIQAKIQDAPFRLRFGQWDFGDGVERAGVFLIDPAPETAPNPVCVVTQQGGPNVETSFSCRDIAAVECSVNIRIWGDKERTDVGLRDLAWSIHELFFGRPPSCLTVDGWTTCNVTISPPQRLTDNEGFPGYAMNMTVVLSKERN